MGSIAYNLMGQLDVIKNEGRSPDYVTLSIGANDICEWNDGYEEEALAFEKILELWATQLTTKFPKVKVVILPVPNLFQVYELMKGQPYCKIKWQTLGICPRLVGAYRTDKERRSFVGKQERANAALQTLSKKFPDQIRYVKIPEGTKIGRDDISRADCFHPSVKAQNYFADMAWKAGWYADLALKPEHHREKSKAGLGDTYRSHGWRGVLEKTLEEGRNPEEENALETFIRRGSDALLKQIELDR